MKPELIQSPYQVPPAVGLSPSELDRYRRRAHYLRAVAFSRLIKSTAHGLSALYRRLQRSRDRRSALADLRRLDERTLRDIGVNRAQIPMIVEQMLARRRQDQAPGKAYPLRALVAPSVSHAVAEDKDCRPPLAA